MLLHLLVAIARDTSGLSSSRAFPSASEVRIALRNYSKIACGSSIVLPVLFLFVLYRAFVGVKGNKLNKFNGKSPTQ